MNGRELPAGWRLVRLSDVLSIKHGYAFPGSGFGSDSSKPQVLTPRNFRIGGGYKDAEPKSYEGIFPREFLLREGSLVVTMTDLSKEVDTLGSLATLPRDRLFLHNQRIGLVTPSDDVDAHFLEYRLRGNDYRAHIVGTASGSTVRHTSPGRIGEFSCYMPPVVEQRAIAEVLGALDDKIAANLRLVEVADRLAAATVEQHLLRSRRVALRDVATITFGTSPSGTSLNEAGEGVAFYQGVRDFGFRSPGLRVSTTAPIRLANAGDILVSVRAPVGSINIAPSTLCIGRGLAAVRSKEAAQSVLFHVLRSPGLWGVFESGGTVFGSISSKELSALAILWPSDPEITERSVAPIEAQIVASVEQNRLLTATRDALLPALMSGRLTVRDAERVVADAT